MINSRRRRSCRSRRARGDAGSYFALGVPVRSAARAPARMPTMPELPSWQAYSKSSSGECRNGIMSVHGFSHVSGSSIVIS